ncbi:hypothetical protein CISIN_1g045025mg, partial [Citrus sinensis]
SHHFHRVKVKIASNSGSASKVVAGDQLVCGTDLLSESRWVDWEDLISSDTVPLVGFVRMVPSFQKHEKIIVEMLLPYHPKYQEKIGFGIDHIKAYNIYSSTRCLLIVQKDGESVDFSYWKCVKGLIGNNFLFHHYITYISKDKYSSSTCFGTNYNPFSAFSFIASTRLDCVKTACNTLFYCM